MKMNTLRTIVVALLLSLGWILIGKKEAPVEGEVTAVPLPNVAAQALPDTILEQKQELKYTREKVLKNKDYIKMKTRIKQKEKQ